MTHFDKLNRDLDAAVAELRGLVDAEMKARHDRGPVCRDVIAARVLAANPALLRRIESLASSDEIHKAAEVVGLGEKSAVRQVYENQVEAEAHKLVASGKAESIEKARATAWQSDRGRLAVYHHPGVERFGLAAIDRTLWRVAADRAIAEVSKVLAPGDPILGHRLATANFPNLAAAARGLPTLYDGE